MQIFFAKICNAQIQLATLELLEETNIVLREEAEVLDTILKIRDTLYTHTESITRIFGAINTTRLKHIRIHHTATEYLYPTGILTE